MARYRSFPVNLLDDPDYFEQSSDTQTVLVGLVLVADDAGRGLAHTDWLARKFNKPEKMIESALAVLVSSDLLQVYEIGKRRYYQLTRWNDWQTLYKPSRSKYPDPPGEEPTNHLPENADDAQTSTRNHSIQTFPELSRKKLENFGKENKCLPEVEGEGEKEEEGEGEEKDSTNCGMLKSKPHNVLPFPHIGNGDGTSQKTLAIPGSDAHNLTRQVAHILKLPVTDALQRLIGEYAAIAMLSLPGEADAAREWIEDPRRNRKRRRMSPAFFRNWLKREMEALEQRQAALQQAAQAQATGTNGKAIAESVPSSGHRPPNLMHLAQEDAQAKGAKRT